MKNRKSWRVKTTWLSNRALPLLSYRSYWDQKVMYDNLDSNYRCISKRKIRVIQVCRFSINSYSCHDALSFGDRFVVIMSKCKIFICNLGSRLANTKLEATDPTEIYFLTCQSRRFPSHKIFEILFWVFWEKDIPYMGIVLFVLLIVSSVAFLKP